MKRQRENKSKSFPSLITREFLHRNKCVFLLVTFMQLCSIAVSRFSHKKKNLHIVDCDRDVEEKWQVFV